MNKGDGAWDRSAGNATAINALSGAPLGHHMPCKNVPPIPADLERQVLVESGHRCAIHSCQQVPVEIAHIVPWSRCHAHEFPNLIALCPTCHTRYDKGQIDRKSMLTYKRNALLQSRRYSDLEKRLLRALATKNVSEIWLLGALAILVSELVADGFLIDSGESRPTDFPETFREKLFKLTTAGEAFVASLRTLEA